MGRLASQDSANSNKGRISPNSRGTPSSKGSPSTSFVKAVKAAEQFLIDRELNRPGRGQHLDDLRMSDPLGIEGNSFSIRLQIDEHKNKFTAFKKEGRETRYFQIHTLLTAHYFGAIDAEGVDFLKAYVKEMMDGLRPELPKSITKIWAKDFKQSHQSSITQTIIFGADQRIEKVLVAPGFGGSPAMYREQKTEHIVGLVDIDWIERKIHPYGARGEPGLVSVPFPWEYYSVAKLKFILIRLVSRLGARAISSGVSRAAARIAQRKAARAASRSKTSRATGRTSSAAGTGAQSRLLTEAQKKLMDEQHPALARYFQRNPKLSLDDDTIREIGSLFKATGRQKGTYQSIRAASGELQALEKLLRNGNVLRVRALRVVTTKGARTADFRVAFNRRTVNVEVTTPTLARTVARKPQRSPSRGGKPQDEGVTHKQTGRNLPPADKTRPATSKDILNAFKRKIKRGQISESNPGVIIINVQRLPRSGAALSRSQIAKLERLIADKTYINELLVAVPTRAGRKFLRVGSRDGGLGIAQGQL